MVQIGSLSLSAPDIDVMSPTCLIARVPDSPSAGTGGVFIRVSNDGENFSESSAEFKFGKRICQNLITYLLVDSINLLKSSEGIPAPREEEIQSNYGAPRELKIFLSSPFRDMQAERDLFVKWVVRRFKIFFFNGQFRRPS